MSIDCKTVMARLEEGSVTGDEETQTHIANCSECRRAGVLVAQLRETVLEPSSREQFGFATRLRAAAIAKERRARKGSLRAVVYAASFAVAGVVTVGVALRAGPFSQYQKSVAQIGSTVGEDRSYEDDGFGGESLLAAIASDEDIEVADLMDD